MLFVMNITTYGQFWGHPPAQVNVRKQRGISTHNPGGNLVGSRLHAPSCVAIHHHRYFIGISAIPDLATGGPSSSPQVLTFIPLSSGSMSSCLSQQACLGLTLYLPCPVRSPGSAYWGAMSRVQDAIARSALCCQEHCCFSPVTRARNVPSLKIPELMLRVPLTYRIAQSFLAVFSVTCFVPSSIIAAPSQSSNICRAVPITTQCHCNKKPTKQEAESKPFLY